MDGQAVMGNGNIIEIVHSEEDADMSIATQTGSKAKPKTKTKKWNGILQFCNRFFGHACFTVIGPSSVLSGYINFSIPFVVLQQYIAVLVCFIFCKGIDYILHYNAPS